MRLAMCQIETEPWDVEGNFQRTIAALHEAGRQRADLAVTPECVFHGYGFHEVPDYAESLRRAAVSRDDPKIRAVQELAKNCSMDIVLGFAEAGDERQVHNSAAFVSGEGELLWVYRKVHCRPFEDARYEGQFTAGDEFYVSRRTYRGRTYGIGTMICFDREIPESVRCLRSLGAELIACPLATGTYSMYRQANEADNEMVTRVRAAENEVFITVVNHARRFNGGSFLVGPGGQSLHQMGAGPGVHVHDVPLGCLQQGIHADPLGWMGWGYRRAEVYDRYLGPVKD